MYNVLENVVTLPTTIMVLKSLFYSNINNHKSDNYFTVKMKNLSLETHYNGDIYSAI